MFKRIGWPKQVVLNTTTLTPEQFMMTSFGGMGVNRLVAPIIDENDIKLWWLKDKVLIGDGDEHFDKTEPIVVTRSQMFWFGRKFGPEQFVIIQGANVEILWPEKPEDYSNILGSLWVPHQDGHLIVANVG